MSAGYAARRMRSISAVTPPIHTASDTPPFSTRASRISYGDSSITAAILTLVPVGTSDATSPGAAVEALGWREISYGCRQGKGVVDANQSRSQGRHPRGRRRPRRAGVWRRLSRPEGAGYRDTLGWRLYDGAAAAADRCVGWDKLPTPTRPRRADRPAQHPAPGEPLRHERRAGGGHRRPCRRSTPAFLVTRTPQGVYNDLGRAEHGHGRLALRPQRPARGHRGASRTPA